MRIRTFSIATAVVAAAAAAALGTAAAQAASAPSPVHHASFFGCFTHNGAGSATEVTGRPVACPAGSILAEGDKGTQGPAGPAGPAGAPGKDGANGIVSTGVSTLVDPAKEAPVTIPTGGPFAANATLAGTVKLPAAGTYLVTLNAKATPLAASAVEVLPQFFIYDGAAKADFSNDLFNVGAGALAVNSTSIDSYYSGTGEVTVTGETQLNVLAFGYDSDRGAGSYALDQLTVTVTQLQAAS